MVSFSFRPQRGDHLAVLRPWKRIYHHGIYIDGNTVIEVIPSRINTCTYADFKDGCPLYIIQYGVRTSWWYRWIKDDLVLNRTFNRKKTAMRAIALRNKGQQWKYHLRTNNCEHCATWVVMGFKYSVQTARVTISFLPLNIAIFNEWERTIVQRSLKIYVDNLNEESSLSSDLSQK